MAIENLQYFEYLRGRSTFGLIYRKYYLYPMLNRYISGVVLDVGCGIGDFLSYRSNTIGADINPYAVKWCLQKGLNAFLMQEDHLPFSSGTFNGVVLDNVIEHLHEPGILIDEIRRVLVSNGILLVGVPGRLGYQADQDHKVFYDEAGLIKVFSDAGFTVSETFYAPIKNKWLESMLTQYCLYGVFLR